MCGKRYVCAESNIKMNTHRPNTSRLDFVLFVERDATWLRGACWSEGQHKEYIFSIWCATEKIARERDTRPCRFDTVWFVFAMILCHGTWIQLMRGWTKNYYFKTKFAMVAPKWSYVSSYFYKTSKLCIFYSKCNYRKINLVNIRVTIRERPTNA